MKKTLFWRVFLLLLAAMTLAALAAALVLGLRAAGTDRLLRIVPAAVWMGLALVLLALGAAALLAGRTVRPIRRLDPFEPGETVPYEELLPLVARLREQDRTIREQQETMGRERRDFNAVTENMSESFLLLDRRLNVLSRNISARYLLPPSEEEGVDNLMRSGAPEGVVRAAEKALAGSRTELTLQMRQRYYQVIATPVYSGSQISGAVLIAMDITEREEREALRREFSANVSHELKTPLTAIAGFAELLRDGMVPPERTAEFAGDIHAESQRLIALVEDIIALSRLEDETQPPPRENVDLWDLAEETLETLRPLAEKRGISLELQGEHLEIQGVRTVLGEMIYNLCDNAVKYNRDDGSITVTVDRQDREYRLCVEDTGIGIPYEHQDRIFERFYRVDKSHSRHMGGTGLGLSIVKHAARMHRARLELRSEPDVGTRITVLFPEE